MRCTQIFASDQKGIIGVGGQLPWRLPRDLAHFKRLTLNTTVLMGRKTFDSIGRALPERRNLVLTRQADFQAEDVIVCEDLERVQSLLQPEERLMVIGGAEIYRLTLPFTDRIEWTCVLTELPFGDARVEPPTPPEWTLVQREEHAADARNPFAMSFRSYVRPLAE